MLCKFINIEIGIQGDSLIYYCIRKSSLEMQISRRGGTIFYISVQS